MKKTLKAVLALFVVLMAGMVSCSSEKAGDDATKSAKPKAAAVSKDALPNYRYVDTDTIMSQYNLAKDYNEEIVRLQNKMESEYKRHQTSIGQLANTMQTKMQNNTYLSQESYQADERKLASLQKTAESQMGELQKQFEQAAMKAQTAIQDSINSYIEDYNAKHGYDAIFVKSAALHFNPALDITDEIVKGLNERYNKVKK
ncbi:MAG: OmpH family outer membrane protein [Bacteroides sp.]|nr:OmpH family outer membrane protein [Bacteroidales bacterium]MBD5337159.1 OmpH family outer membrane protein [Bacteroides sp.]